MLFTGEWVYMDLFHLSYLGLALFSSSSSFFNADIQFALLISRDISSLITSLALAFASTFDSTSAFVFLWVGWGGADYELWSFLGMDNIESIYLLRKNENIGKWYKHPIGAKDPLMVKDVDMVDLGVCLLSFLAY